VTGKKQTSKKRARDGQVIYRGKAVNSIVETTETGEVNIDQEATAEPAVQQGQTSNQEVVYISS